jgi:hypothetical protein
VGSFRRLVEAKLRHQLVTEASLSHFYQVWLDSGEKSFAILTSWRGSDSLSKNKENFEDIKKRLRAWGYGYIRTMGNWKGGSEPSLFIPGISRARAVGLMHMYEQEAILYAGPDTNGQAVIIASDGEITNIGPWHSRKGDNWTSWKNRNFTFEAQASSWSESLLEKFLRLLE